MEGVTIIVRTIERGWHLALALIVVSGSVIAAHRLGLPELAVFRGWVQWATIGLGWGISIALFGTVAWIVRRAHSGSTSSRTRREKAEASKQQAEAEFRKLELATFRRKIDVFGRVVNRVGPKQQPAGMAGGMLF